MCNDRELLERFECSKRSLSIHDNLVVRNRFFSACRNLFEWHVPEGGCVSCIRQKRGDGAAELRRTP